MKRTTKAFTLVEIMVVTGIIAIIVAIAAPTWLRQREVSRGRACQENLQKISNAAEQFALDYKLSNGHTINYPSDLMMPEGATQAGQGYLKKTPYCPADGEYALSAVGDQASCSIGTSAYIEPHVLH